MSERETTFDAQVKPKFYLLLDKNARAALGGVEVGEILTVTAKKKVRARDMEES